MRTTPGKRTALLAVVPLVAIATFMVGLRVGAKDAVRAAVVLGAPPAGPLPDGKTHLAWQLLTLVDDHGVRETVAMHGLVVTVRTADGRTSAWSGDTNEDGIAEMTFTFDALEPGAPLDVEVKAPGDPAPLAHGRVAWEDAARTTRPSNAARPAKRNGPVLLDVLVDGERLVTGFDSEVWIRAHVGDGIPPSSVTLALAPEPGLEVGAESLSLCDGSGATRWAHVKMRATSHVTGLGIEAKAGGREVGSWFGALPVAPGAFQVTFPRALPSGAVLDARIDAPNPRTVVYAEVDDARGRVFAAALEVRDGARFSTPPLGPGLHWLVVSGEPRGAEHLGGAAMAFPFTVGDAPRASCELGPYLLDHAADGFPRWTALDGLPARHTKNRGRHAAGLAIALVSLVTAVILEVLLLGAAAREAKAVIAAATADDPEAEVEALTRRSSGGSHAVAILLVVLGFALLAALVVAKG